MSITGLLGVLATLGAIAIAFGIKRIPWRTPLRILIASYWFSFGMGVVQWLSIHLHIKPLTDYFAHLMCRQYINESSVWGSGHGLFGPQLLDTYMQDGSRWPSMLGGVI